MSRSERQQPQAIDFGKYHFETTLANSNALPAPRLQKDIVGLAQIASLIDPTQRPQYFQTLKPLVENYLRNHTQEPSFTITQVTDIAAGNYLMLQTTTGTEEHGIFYPMTLPLTQPLPETLHSTTFAALSPESQATITTLTAPSEQTNEASSTDPLKPWYRTRVEGIKKDLAIVANEAIFS